jgi:hypothetical protein
MNSHDIWQSFISEEVLRNMDLSVFPDEYTGETKRSDTPALNTSDYFQEVDGHGSECKIPEQVGWLCCFRGIPSQNRVLVLRGNEIVDVLTQAEVKEKYGVNANDTLQLIQAPPEDDSFTFKRDGDILKCLKRTSDGSQGDSRSEEEESRPPNPYNHPRSRRIPTSDLFTMPEFTDDTQGTKQQRVEFTKKTDSLGFGLGYEGSPSTGNQNPNFLLQVNPRGDMTNTEFQKAGREYISLFYRGKTTYSYVPEDIPLWCRQWERYLGVETAAWLRSRFEKKRSEAERKERDTLDRINKESERIRCFREETEHMKLAEAMARKAAERKAQIDANIPSGSLPSHDLEELDYDPLSTNLTLEEEMREIERTGDVASLIFGLQVKENGQWDGSLHYDIPSTGFTISAGVNRTHTDQAQSTSQLDHVNLFDENLLSFDELDAAMDSLYSESEQQTQSQSGDKSGSEDVVMSSAASNPGPHLHTRSGKKARSEELDDHHPRKRLKKTTHDPMDIECRLADRFTTSLDLPRMSGSAKVNVSSNLAPHPANSTAVETDCSGDDDEVVMVPTSPQKPTSRREIVKSKSTKKLFNVIERRNSQERGPILHTSSSSSGSDWSWGEPTSPRSRGRSMKPGTSRFTSRSDSRARAAEPSLTSRRRSNPRRSSSNTTHVASRDSSPPKNPQDERIDARIPVEGDISKAKKSGETTLDSGNSSKGPSGLSKPEVMTMASAFQGKVQPTMSAKKFEIRLPKIAGIQGYVSATQALPSDFTVVEVKATSAVETGKPVLDVSSSGRLQPLRSTYRPLEELSPSERARQHRNHVRNVSDGIPSMYPQYDQPSLAGFASAAAFPHPNFGSQIYHQSDPNSGAYMGLRTGTAADQYAQPIYHGYSATTSITRQGLASNVPAGSFPPMNSWRPTGMNMMGVDPIFQPPAGYSQSRSKYGHTRHSSFDNDRSHRDFAGLTGPTRQAQFPPLDRAYGENRRVNAEVYSQVQAKNPTQAVRSRGGSQPAPKSLPQKPNVAGFGRQVVEIESTPNRFPTPSPNITALGGERTVQADGTPIKFPKLSPSRKPTSSRIWFAHFESHDKQFEASRRLQLAIDKDGDLAFKCLREVADLDGKSMRLRVSTPASFDPRQILHTIFPDEEFNLEGEN